MTREKCKKLLPLFIAFANGAHVEYKNHNDEWITSENIGFGITGTDRYRVNGKPYIEGDVRLAIEIVIAQIKDKMGGIDLGSMLERVKNKLN
jgi:hypothetical protein